MLKLAVMFADNMVLQQTTDLPVWGTTNIGMLVTVRFAGQEKSVKADANGDWRVNLEPLTANSRPQEMQITVNDSASHKNYSVHKQEIVGKPYYLLIKNSKSLIVLFCSENIKEI